MPFNPLKCDYGCCTIPQRFVLCIMTFLGIVNAYNMRVCINITLPEMVVPKPHKPGGSISKDQTCPGNLSQAIKISGGTYNWTENQQQNILGLFFYGYVITHIPGGWLADALGGRHILSQSVFLSGLVTVFTPIMVDYGGASVLAGSRVIMGLAQGVLFPAASALVAKWIPKHERSFWGALTMTGSIIGSVTGNFFSAAFLTAGLSWRLVFYIWAVMGFVWYAFFLFMCFSEPAKHPFITEKEAEMLDQEIGKPEKMKNIPWLKIMFYPPDVALMIGEIGHGVVFFFIVTELPKYMKDVLKYNVKESGVLNALPHISLWICSTFVGWVSDYLIRKNLLTILLARIIFGTIGSIGPCICVVAAGYLGCNRDAAAAMFVLAMFVMGPFYPGMRVNVLDISKNFAGILFAFVNGIGALAFIPIPYLIAWLAPDHTLDQWRLVLWIILIISVIANVIYIIWASAERAPWDQVKE